MIPIAARLAALLWTVGDRGGVAPANRRIAASSVGSISRADIDPPCVLALLGSRRPGITAIGINDLNEAHPPLHLGKGWGSDGLRLRGAGGKHVEHVRLVGP